MVAITIRLALLALLSPLVSSTVAHGPSACPAWCKEHFLTDAECISPAESSEGPCFQCGPASYDPNTAVCNGICVNLRKDEFNCGACGVQSGEGNSCCNGMSVDLLTSPFACGRCGVLVPEGKICCGGHLVNPLDDVANCGACGAACPAGKTCQNRACT